MARPWGSVVVKVLAAFDRNPKASSREIASEVGGIDSSYVRATLRRNGYVLKRSTGRKHKRIEDTRDDQH